MIPADELVIADLARSMRERHIPFTRVCRSLKKQGALYRQTIFQTLIVNTQEPYLLIPANTKRRGIIFLASYATDNAYGFEYSYGNPITLFAACDGFFTPGVNHYGINSRNVPFATWLGTEIQLSNGTVAIDDIYVTAASVDNPAPPAPPINPVWTPTIAAAYEITAEPN